jgi:hypothetical protein
MHPQYRGVAFLLSLGALPLACDKGNDDTTTDATGNGPATTTTDATDAEPTGGTGTAATPDEICQAYVDRQIGCMPAYSTYAEEIRSECLSYFMDGLMADGPACVEALSALFICFNALPCDSNTEEICAAEEDAVSAACPSFSDMTEPSESTSADTGADETGTNSGSSG